MKNNLNYIASYVYEDKRFFSNIEYNGLFAEDITTHHIEFVSFFENEMYTERFIHRDVIGVGERLFFIPFFGKGVSVYNSLSKKMRFVEINAKKNFSVVAAYLFKDKIIIVPSEISCGLFCLDINTLTINKIGLNITIDLSDKLVDLFGTCMYENKLYIAIYEDKQILEVDLESYDTVIHSLVGDYSIRNISIVDDKMWIVLLNEQSAIRVDLHNFNDIKVTPIIIESDNERLLRVIEWNDEIIVLPGNDKFLYKYDNESQIFKKINKEIPSGFYGDIVGYYAIEKDLILISQKHPGIESEIIDGRVIISNNTESDIDIEYVQYEKYDEYFSMLKKKSFEYDFEESGMIQEKNNDVNNLKNLIEYILD